MSAPLMILRYVPKTKLVLSVAGDPKLRPRVTPTCASGRVGCSGGPCPCQKAPMVEADEAE